jgi:hypothetical protein
MVQARQALFKLTIVFFCLAIALSAHSKSPEEDHQKNIEYREFCEQNREFIVRNRYAVECFHNYHHYNANAASRFYQRSRAISQGELKISSLNFLHPGTAKVAYKNYALLAEMVNQWDLIAAQELLAVVARDFTHNRMLLDFIDRGPGLVSELKAQLQIDPRNQELRQRLQQTQSDLAQAPALYRSPGYLDLLHELQKIDPSWSLILAPRGEAAESRHVQELTGFYYRASKVKPEINPHCQAYQEQERNGIPFGCIPEFDRPFMDRDTAQAFSRRPFMASFKSHEFEFSLLTTHVIFTSPRDENKIKEIMSAAFGVESFENLGAGISIGNYARWAEIKLVMDFMENYRRRYRRDNIIFAGDMNMDSENPFWSEVLATMPGSKVLIDDPTTLSQLRIRVSGIPTNGVANNYDHFVLRPSAFSNCQDRSGNMRSRVVSLYEGPVAEKIRRQYYIRYRDGRSVARLDEQGRKYEDEGDDDNDNDDDSDAPMPMNLGPEYQSIPSAERLMAPLISQLHRELLKQKTIRDDQIIEDHYRVDQLVENYRQRVFLSQLYNRTYHRIYQELLTDHMPIELTCKTSLR